MDSDSQQFLHSQLDCGSFDFQALCASQEEIPFTHADGRVETFKPDGFKGYFRFTVATAFPAGRLIYGIGMHPQTIANHYLSLLHQHTDNEHKMAYNSPGNKNAEDSIIGSIVAVSFPRPPNGAATWSISEPCPAISGVAVFWKNAQATMRALSKHMMGRHNSSVSMDFFYNHDDGGFAIKVDGGNLFEGGESKDFFSAGYEYVSWQNAPQELRACMTLTNQKVTEIKKGYKGRQVTFMAGGAGAGVIRFAGLAVVRYGAEPTAQLGHVVASDVPPIEESISEFGKILREAAASELVKQSY